MQKQGEGEEETCGVCVHHPCMNGGMATPG